ncbi:MAG: hypothetical protein KIH09_10265 [Candidatus Freyarchaeota archaeon]|nr:hypothetical protein [Candidatus Jordarchaeia archaeon]
MKKKLGTKGFVAFLVALVLMYLGVYSSILVSYSYPMVGLMKAALYFFFPLLPAVISFFFRSFWNLRRNFEFFGEAWRVFKNYIKERFKQKRVKVISVPLGYISAGIVLGSLFSLILLFQEEAPSLSSLLIDVSVGLFNTSPLHVYLFASLLIYANTRIVVGFISILAVAMLAFAFTALGLFNEKLLEDELKNLK